jgi:arylsulfatase A-like enzyme
MEQCPNIVFVLTDDQGYGDLGCHGNDTIQTPHIDRFYQDAVRLTDFHVGSTCAPTRAGILTGHFCNSAGVWHTIGGRSLLREDEWTLADALSAAGYRTGHFGKWHLGDSQPFRPHERGFDESVYHAGGGIGNTGDHWGNDYFDDTYFKNGVPTAYQGYCTDVFFREGMRFISENADQPFFCYIATNAPHGPLNVEPRYVDLYRDSTPHEDRARFYGMISNIDDNFGRLQSHLHELGLSDNTILIFMTDNGTATGVELDSEQYPQEGPGSYNAGMRGKKGSPYEGGHRVPFLVRFPNGQVAGGRDMPALASYVDFMPTLLELCNADVPNERSFHGQSIAPMLRGQDPPADWSGRVNVCDTQRVAHPVKWRKSSVMKKRWRLINGRELYDLDSDPGQRRDIAAEHPGIVSELRQDYELWWENISDQFDRDVPIALGGDDEEVKLTTHDLRNETCNGVWNHRQVRAGQVSSGYWAVDIRQSGRYEIELRRWPEETGYALTAAIEGDDSNWRRDSIKPEDAPAYEGGVALAIQWAQLTIGDANYQAEVDPAGTSALFTVELTTGPDQLFAAFHDHSERTIAPYYVYIRRLP